PREKANHRAERRRQMVAAVRRGDTLRVVARRFRVSVATVAYWVRRAADQRLDRVDWHDRPSTPQRTQRTAGAVEDQVLRLRQELTDSDLGACGAAAIQDALRQRPVDPVPSLRTINRILARRGALDGH